MVTIITCGFLAVFLYFSIAKAHSCMFLYQEVQGILNCMAGRERGEIICERGVLDEGKREREGKRPLAHSALAKIFPLFLLLSTSATQAEDISIDY